MFVRVQSGAIIKMDVPTNPHARERYDAAIAKREFTLVDADQVEEVDTRHGGKAHQLRQPPAEAEAAPARPKRKQAASTESPDKD